MRDRFPGYYHPSDDEFQSLWETGTFVLDANVLLNLYRYTPPTQRELMDTIALLQGQLWIPHQVAYEFARNRAKVLIGLQLASDELGKTVRASVSDLRKRLVDWRDRHPTIDVAAIVGALDEFELAAVAELEEAEASFRDEYGDDPTGRDTNWAINWIISRRIGSPYPQERLKEIYREGKSRFAAKTPPGYLDSDKAEPDRYGDLVLWRQIMDYAEETGLPIVLVTDDVKEDWWWRVKGRTLGPRPELVQEMRDATGMLFHLYTSKRFLETAVERIGATASGAALKEIAAMADATVPWMASLALRGGIPGEEEAGHEAEANLHTSLLAGVEPREAISEFLDRALFDHFEFDPQRVLEIVRRGIDGRDQRAAKQEPLSASDLGWYQRQLDIIDRVTTLEDLIRDAGDSDDEQADDEAEDEDDG